jgi:hypothetical protein
MPAVAFSPAAPTALVQRAGEAEFAAAESSGEGAMTSK